MAHPSNWMFRRWKKQHFSNRRPHPHEVFSKDKVLSVVVPYPKKIIELFEAHKITEIYKSPFKERYIYLKRDKCHLLFLVYC